VRLASEATWGDQGGGGAAAAVPVDPDLLCAALGDLPLHERLLLPASYDHQRLYLELQSTSAAPLQPAATSPSQPVVDAEKTRDKEAEEELDELLKL
jgi:hypothetical protein